MRIQLHQLVKVNNGRPSYCNGNGILYDGLVFVAEAIYKDNLGVVVQSSTYLYFMPLSRSSTMAFTPMFLHASVPLLASWPSCPGSWPPS
jgi:hypothetical protein